MPKGKKGRKVEGRRRREFSYRGLTLGRLKEMSLPELAQVLPARARRSIRRGFTVEVQRFLERMRETSADKVLRTHTRDALILPEHVGRRVAVHNGKEYKEIEVRPEMIGHYYGEFSLTRRFEKHSGPGVGATRSSKFMPLK
ncbi:MAG: 30S ribosomal protein S19 [Candidatus Thermoplasmatota archaeon]|jgi:small subunit ribosomal protein S19|nr:30S ribosomal protein S19 [Candidatus Thermoplasmatota archaeon]MCL5983419.1 30S ribosomal protein S19 [Candidatus Thermoplasmatota archaeon]